MSILLFVNVYKHNVYCNIHFLNCGKEHYIFHEIFFQKMSRVYQDSVLQFVPDQGFNYFEKYIQVYKQKLHRNENTFRTEVYNRKIESFGNSKILGTNCTIYEHYHPGFFLCRFQLKKTKSKSMQEFCIASDMKNRDDQLRFS